MNQVQARKTKTQIMSLNLNILRMKTLMAKARMKHKVLIFRRKLLNKNPKPQLNLFLKTIIKNKFCENNPQTKQYKEWKSL